MLSSLITDLHVFYAQISSKSFLIVAFKNYFFYNYFVFVGINKLGNDLFYFLSNEQLHSLRNILAPVL